MSRLNGSLARTLDFGEMTTTWLDGAREARSRSAGLRGARAGLRLALPSGVLRGPDKYKVLEHRRRQAQITARRLLELMEGD